MLFDYLKMDVNEKNQLDQYIVSLVDDYKNSHPIKHFGTKSMWGYINKTLSDKYELKFDIKPSLSKMKKNVINTVSACTDYKKKEEHFFSMVRHYLPLFDIIPPRNITINDVLNEDGGHLRKITRKKLKRKLKKKPIVKNNPDKTYVVFKTNLKLPEASTSEQKTNAIAIGSTNAVATRKRSNSPDPSQSNSSCLQICKKPFIQVSYKYGNLHQIKSGNGAVFKLKNGGKRLILEQPLNQSNDQAIDLTVKQPVNQNKEQTLEESFEERSDSLLSGEQSTFDLLLSSQSRDSEQENAKDPSISEQNTNGLAYSSQNIDDPSPIEQIIDSYSPFNLQNLSLSIILDNCYDDLSFDLSDINNSSYEDDSDDSSVYDLGKIIPSRFEDISESHCMKFTQNDSLMETLNLIVPTFGEYIADNRPSQKENSNIPPALEPITCGPSTQNGIIDIGSTPHRETVDSSNQNKIGKISSTIEHTICDYSTQKDISVNPTHKKTTKVLSNQKEIVNIPHTLDKTTNDPSNEKVCPALNEKSSDHFIKKEKYPTHEKTDSGPSTLKTNTDNSYHKLNIDLSYIKQDIEDTVKSEFDYNFPELVLPAHDPSTITPAIREQLNTMLQLYGPDGVKQEVTATDNDSSVQNIDPKNLFLIVSLPSIPKGMSLFFGPYKDPHKLCTMEKCVLHPKPNEIGKCNRRILGSNLKYDIPDGNGILFDSLKVIIHSVYGPSYFMCTNLAGPEYIIALIEEVAMSVDYCNQKFKNLLLAFSKTSLPSTSQGNLGQTSGSNETSPDADENYLEIMQCNFAVGKCQIHNNPLDCMKNQSIIQQYNQYLIINQMMKNMNLSSKRSAPKRPIQEMNNEAPNRFNSPPPQPRFHKIMEGTNSQPQQAMLPEQEAIMHSRYTYRFSPPLRQSYIPIINEGAQSQHKQSMLSEQEAIMHSHYTYRFSPPLRQSYIPIINEGGHSQRQQAMLPEQVALINSQDTYQDEHYNIQNSRLGLRTDYGDQNHPLMNGSGDDDYPQRNRSNVLPIHEDHDIPEWNNSIMSNCYEGNYYSEDDISATNSNDDEDYIQRPNSAVSNHDQQQYDNPQINNFNLANGDDENYQERNNLDSVRSRNEQEYVQRQNMASINNHDDDYYLESNSFPLISNQDNRQMNMMPLMSNYGNQHYSEISNLTSMSSYSVPNYPKINSLALMRNHDNQIYPKRYHMAPINDQDNQLYTRMGRLDLTSNHDQKFPLQKDHLFIIGNNENSYQTQRVSSPLISHDIGHDSRRPTLTPRNQQYYNQGSPHIPLDNENITENESERIYYLTERSDIHRQRLLNNQQSSPVYQMLGSLQIPKFMVEINRSHFSDPPPSTFYGQDESSNLRSRVNFDCLPSQAIRRYFYPDY